MRYPSRAIMGLLLLADAAAAKEISHVRLEIVP
jgi:hypothetical protein